MMEEMQVFLGDSGVSSALGLAFDEAMVVETGRSETGRSMLRIYSYADHCVLLGRFQRTEAEVNLDEAKNRNISINRRSTGGGAILMGNDQIGVAFAISSDRFASARQGFSRFADAVIGALEIIGITAALRGKNDIEVNGKKIAGLGFYQSGRAILFHASLLFDLDKELLLSLLKVPLAKLGAHGLQAISDRTTTVIGELGSDASFQRVQEALIDSFERIFEAKSIYEGASDALIATSRDLLEEKYATTNWLFEGGRGACGEFSTDIRTAIGTLRLVIANQGEVIKSAVVTGDFNSAPRELIELEEVLRWAVIDETLLTRRIIKSLDASKVLDPMMLSRAICESYQNVHQKAEPRRIGSCYIPEELTS